MRFDLFSDICLVIILRHYICFSDIFAALVRDYFVHTRLAGLLGYFINIIYSLTPALRLDSGAAQRLLNPYPIAEIV